MDNFLFMLALALGVGLAANLGTQAPLEVMDGSMNIEERAIVPLVHD
ncbi:MAG: hypothetical protein ACO4AI_01835 [Prochlorothrix sp.]